MPGHIIPIGAQVRLRIKVANMKKHIVDYLANKFNYDCVLGADWHRIFDAMIDPEKHILLLDRQETIPLEFDVTGRNRQETIHLEFNVSGRNVSACLAALGSTVADEIELQWSTGPVLAAPI